MKKLLNLSSSALFVIFLFSGLFLGTLQASSGEVVCKEAMLNNYRVALSKCSDNQTWELDCQLDNATQAYQCSCKKAGTETKKTSMTDKPYAIATASMDQDLQNAVAGANKICGFKLKYQP